MKARTAILVLGALLLAMIGAAWSQRSANPNIPIPLPCGNSNTNTTVDCSYVRTHRRWAPVIWNGNISQWEIDYDTWANSNSTTNSLANGGYYDGPSLIDMAPNVANYATAVNANSWANKPARPTKKRSTRSTRRPIN